MEALRQRFVGHVVRCRRPAGCGEQVAQKQEPAAQLKSAITGIYRAVRDKHVLRYLAEFEYRFNRRYDLAAMIPRLGYVAVRTSPMPYRLLNLAEDHT